MKDIYTQNGTQIRGRMTKYRIGNTIRQLRDVQNPKPKTYFLWSRWGIKECHSSIHLSVSVYVCLSIEYFCNHSIPPTFFKGFSQNFNYILLIYLLLFMQQFCYSTLVPQVIGTNELKRQPRLHFIKELYCKPNRII